MKDRAVTQETESFGQLESDAQPFLEGECFALFDDDMEIMEIGFHVYEVFLGPIGELLDGKVVLGDVARVGLTYMVQKTDLIHKGLY